MLIGLDLDGVLCDLGPEVAARIGEAFGVATHPATWRTYDLRRLRLGVPQDRLVAFLDETFGDPSLYAAAPCHAGAASGVSRLRAAGWLAVGITARPTHLADVTRAWLRAQGLELEAVYHTALGAKHELARELGVAATIEDNPIEAESLAEVCESWLLEQPYNREYPLERARRLYSWDDAVGRLCQMQLFA